MMPTMKVEEIDPAQMLAESLFINSGTTVRGEDALVKENCDWDIWGDE